MKLGSGHAQRCSHGPSPFADKGGRNQALAHNLITHVAARWFLDGKRFVFSGTEPATSARLYVQAITEDKPRASP